MQNFFMFQQMVTLRFKKLNQRNNNQQCTGISSSLFFVMTIDARQTKQTILFAVFKCHNSNSCYVCCCFFPAPHCYQLEQNVFTGVALSGYSLYARLYYPSMGIQ